MGKLYRDEGGVLVPHTQFDYNATSSKGRRQSPKSTTASNDTVLTKGKRRKLQATAQDQARNLSLMAWMIRKHVTYVSQFTPYIRTSNPELDKRVMALLAWHARKRNFDIAGRHGRDRFMSLFEAGKVVNGDAAWLTLKTGQNQGIPSDRITKPRDLNNTMNKRINDHGLEVDRYGRVLNYCICKRDKKEILYSHLEKAENVIFDGYFDGFDQFRGVSPLSTAINTLQDVYEGWEYTLIKIKMHAFFGMAIHREDGDGDGFPTTATAGVDTDTDGSTEPEKEYAVDFNKPGMLLDLDPGDQVDTIESKTPNAEFIDYSHLMVRVALLALDIPYTMFDSMKSSFSASKRDRIEYEESARSKRRSNIECLHEYSDRSLRRWGRTGGPLAEALAAAGVDARYVADALEWLPMARPWYDEKAEVTAANDRVGGGLSSRQRETIIRGDNWWKIADELAEEEAYAAKKGITLTIGTPGAATSGEAAGKGQEADSNDSDGGQEDG